MIVYRKLKPEDMDIRLFQEFQRRQAVTHCWQKTGNGWLKKIRLSTIGAGRTMPSWFAALGIPLPREAGFAGRFYPRRKRQEAFSRICLRRGHSSWQPAAIWGPVQPARLPGDARQRHRQAAVHKSRGICRNARGGKAIYFIPSRRRNPGLYRAMGCVEAQEYQPEHGEREPQDYPLEYMSYPDKYNTGAPHLITMRGLPSYTRILILPAAFSKAVPGSPESCG